uniref:Uncharacterized protein n=1 Tax=viral metagenome TaxID=1070528 RepID=A0A6C0B058_9ZZZZ
MDESEIKIYIETTGGDIQIDSIKFKKMLLLFNAINDGWCIKKKKDAYIFTKNHEGKREILLDSYLLTFMEDNFDINKLLS